MATYVSHSTVCGMIGEKQIDGFLPEWYIFTMIYSRDTPFWSETLEIQLFSQIASVCFHCSSMLFEALSDM